ncbi:xylulokinase [Candidatus Bathyarchaeota archaeon]|nr:xylulokinase [Candidatus Bathyarchaeota archaeon]
MTYLVGVDVGTSSTKAVVIDEDGRVLARSSSEYGIDSPKPGWVEQDPTVWWNATRNVIKALIKNSEINPNMISAVGFSGQMHGTVMIGRDRKPIRPAIIWTDKRSLKECDEIYRRLGRSEVLKVTCNPIMPGFMAPTLLWIRKNEPKNLKEAFKVLPPKDYVRLRMTGSIATDPSDASATLLFDVKARRWSEYLALELGLPQGLLPPVIESTEVAGEVTEEASEETGLPEGTPVITGGGDSQVGAVGCGAIKPGVITSNIGTGGQIFSTTDEAREDPNYRVHLFCHAVPGRWCLQGAILSAGLSLRWFRDNLAQPERMMGTLCNIDPYTILSEEAETAEPGCRGLIFLPYLVGERSPHMDPQAKGVLYGLTIEHRRAHLIRSVMEGVTYALRDCLEVFRELGVEVRRVIARGGGARSRLWRRIQASVFGVEVVRVDVEEEVAFGAALLAGVGVGVYKNLDEACERTIRILDREEPDAEEVEIYNDYYRNVYRRLYPSLKPIWSEHPS